MKAYLGHRLIQSKRMWIWPGNKRQSYGKFSQVLTASGAGRVYVVVTHDRNDALSGFRAAAQLHGPRHERRLRLDRALRPADPAAPRRAALLHPADRRLRLRHMGLAIDAYHRLLGWGIVADARRQDDQLPAQRLGHVHGPLPDARPSRRGQPGQAAAGPGRRRQRQVHLPDQLRQAVDADRARQLPHLPQRPRLPAGRDVLLAASSSAATRSTGTTRRRTIPASHGCMRLPIMDAIFDLQLAELRRRGRRLLLGPTADSGWRRVRGVSSSRG